MLSGSCFFRGNYMNESAARSLLRNLCTYSHLIPEYWNTFEPIDIPFRLEEHDEVIAAMTPSPESAIRSLVFAKRRLDPQFLLSIDLCLAPLQWTSPHNCLSFEECTADEEELARYFIQCIIPAYPDYASIPDWTKDTNRYRELKRAYSGKELTQMLAKRTISLPFGPLGCLGDIHWFNYFGSTYVHFIGRERLVSAGWARVEPIGDGLACYSTIAIDDPEGPTRRLAIAEALKEFVWTPGCRSEEKRVPDFDYSEQFAALPADVVKELNSPRSSIVATFEGLSPDEREKALRTLKENE